MKEKGKQNNNKVHNEQKQGSNIIHEEIGCDNVAGRCTAWEKVLTSAL